MAKRARKYKHPGMADMPLVTDVTLIALNDGDLFKRHTDLVIRGACKRMKKGTFSAGKFCPFIRKNTVNHALNAYYGEQLFSGGAATRHGVDTATLNVLGAELCKDLMRQARERASESGKC